MRFWGGGEIPGESGVVGIKGIWGIRGDSRRFGEIWGLLSATSHSSFYHRVGQIAIFSHCQP